MKVYRLLPKHLYSWDSGIWTKSSCCISNGALGRKKWPCDPCSDFPGLYLGQIVRQAYTLWAIMGDSFQTYSFPHTAIFLSAHWVKDCTYQGNGWIPTGTIIFCLFYHFQIIYMWWYQNSLFLLPYLFLFFSGNFLSLQMEIFHWVGKVNRKQ